MTSAAAPDSQVEAEVSLFLSLLGQHYPLAERAVDRPLRPQYNREQVFSALARHRRLATRIARGAVTAQLMLEVAHILNAESRSAAPGMGLSAPMAARAAGCEFYLGLRQDWPAVLASEVLKHALAASTGVVPMKIVDPAGLDSA